MDRATWSNSIVGRLAGLVVALALGSASRPAPAQVNVERPQTLGIGVEEHLGRQIPGEIEFTTSDGKNVLIGDYFKGNKPSIIAMVYYHCPVVCAAHLDKLHEALNAIEPTIGKDFQVLIFGFDPTETTDDAAKVREAFIAEYNRPVNDQVRAGWQFHVGSGASARQLADALGFQYKKLDNGEYSHPVALFITTPDGKIARYFFGFFEAAELTKNIKLSLIEAASGRLAKSLGDKLLAFCYMYDPASGAYTLRAIRVMQVGGVLTMIALGSLIGVYLVGERMVRRKKALALAAAGANAGASARTVTDSVVSDPRQGQNALAGGANG